MVDLHGFTLPVWPGFFAIVITFGMVKLPSVDVTEDAGTVKFNNRWSLLCLCSAVKCTQFSFATFRISAGPFMVKSPLECKESRIFDVWFLSRSWSKSIKAGCYIIFQSVCSLITLLYDSLLLFVHSFGMLDSNIGTKWLGVHVPVPRVGPLHMIVTGCLGPFTTGYTDLTGFLMTEHAACIDQADEKE